MDSGNEVTPLVYSYYGIGRCQATSDKEGGMVQEANAQPELTGNAWKGMVQLPG